MLRRLASSSSSVAATLKGGAKIRHQLVISTFTRALVSSTNPTAMLAVGNHNQEYFATDSIRNRLAFVAAAGATLFGAVAYHNSTDCCGIAGVVGTPDYDARYVKTQSVC